MHILLDPSSYANSDPPHALLQELFITCFSHRTPREAAFNEQAFFAELTGHSLPNRDCSTNLCSSYSIANWMLHECAWYAFYLIKRKKMKEKKERFSPFKLILIPVD